MPANSFSITATAADAAETIEFGGRMMLKSEIRNPKSEGNPKPEIRNTGGQVPISGVAGTSGSKLSSKDNSPVHAAASFWFSIFEFRISFGFRISDFGFSPASLLAFLSLLAIATATATAAPATEQFEFQRTQRLYISARDACQPTPTNAEAARLFGKACFDFAEFATNSTQRAALAEEGIAASRKAIALSPTNGAAFYALGLNLGQLARTRTLGALKLVSQIEKAFQQAIALDAKCDFAGPHRLLGLLYQKAPGWPASVGSKKKARVQLEKAAELAPGYADNWLCLLEACLEWDDSAAAAKLLPKTEEALKASRTKFTGEEWAWALQDWEERWRKIQKQTSPTKPGP